MLQHDNSLSAGLPISTIIIADEPPPTYTNDDFDDVFGSPPSSPSLLPRQPPPGNLEPSDIPRMRKKHEKEGYRDGVTKGKGQSVQAGFDEGYGLGAVLGLSVGKMLGILEGIVAGAGEGGRERVEGLLGKAREELAARNVFAREFWADDGIWTFDVPGEEGQVLFRDVAAAHPLVRKWEGMVEEEIKTWGLDLGVLDGEREGDEMEDGAHVGVGGQGAQCKEAKKEELETEPVAAGMAKALGVSKKDLSW